MTTSKMPTDAALAWAVESVGGDGTVVAVRGLREGSNPWLLRIDHDGGTVEAVLKTAHTEDPGGLATEIAALRLAEERGIPAPRIIAVDVEGDSAGTRAILETVVPGRSTIPVEPTAERLHALGAAVAALCAVPAQPSPALPLRIRPISASDFARARRRGTDHTTPLLDAADQEIRRLPVPGGRTVLVHGDIWQGNLMWEGDAFSGMLDWDMAGVGHPGVDLCALRLDAALTYGRDAAEPVLAGWERATGERAEDLAYWDAVAALNQPGDMAVFAPVMHDQGRDDLTAGTLNERRDAFLRAALDRL
ncbi:aminoglycoside phosphotransferase family protein [Streptomyces sp. B6B3]|uniref:aminoglycoside phosphotransferase family protein n=1 Tax=Streptomyces sp. B6B3 TaxID=3153570 RepID=UPI00325D27A9